jgi:hypothetical protein
LTSRIFLGRLHAGITDKFFEKLSFCGKGLDRELDGFLRNLRLPQEEANFMASGVVGSRKTTPPCKNAMRSAIAFGLVIVILGVFLPGVIHAMDVFLLTLFDRATALVQALPSAESGTESIAAPRTAQPAIVNQAFTH